MIVVDDEKVERRLNSEGNLALKLGKGNRINHDDAGRNEGDKNLHPVLRSIISAAAQVDTAKNTAENFGISQSHAHNLKHGRTTPNGEVNPAILDGKKNILDEVKTQASDILLKVLGLIPQKLDEEKGKMKITQITQVAKDMASIVEKATPNKDRQDLGPKIVIITAPARDIKTYDTIEIGVVHEN